jgi:superfamily I DNA/RNA helicase
MANWMIDASRLDDQQIEVLELASDESKIIKGCAGSGKTVLAVHKADRIRKKQQGSFYILVYTRALRAFIQDGIDELGIPNASVLYEWEWRRKGCPQADYLLIDESQDFSEQDITLFKKSANQAITFFGDSAQQVYDTKINFQTNQRDKTVTIEEIQRLTSLSSIQLNYNHRLPESIAKVAQCLLRTGEDIVSGCAKKGGDKAILKKCSTPENELDWIIHRIKNEGLKDVGILLPENIQVKFVYDYLQLKNMKAGVRYSENNRVNEALDFKGNIPNIMPYHSSKGLQFETVFLPFCEANINSSFWRNAFYVALTRTFKTLIVTYTHSLTPFFNEVDATLYQKI